MDGRGVSRGSRGVMTVLHVPPPATRLPAQYNPPEGIVPADLVLACGVFGNISDADIGRTIATLPQMTRAGGTVIWTRSRRSLDLTSAIRQAFGEADFTETAFHAPDDVLFSVGACRFHGEPQPLQATTLFTFIT